MNWNERIQLCKTLLNDMKDMIPEGSEEEKKDATLTLETIEQYTASEAFKENKDCDKEKDSWSILLNTLERCCAYLEPIGNKLFPHPPKFVTREEAFNKLIESYAMSMKDGDEAIASLNINEWMATNHFVIVDEDDERRNSSSSNEESVNSQSKF